MRFPIIDAHVHFWDPKTTPREVSILVNTFGFNQKLVGFLAEKLFPKSAKEFFASPEYILKTYAIEEFNKDSDDYTIEGVVHVEASWKGKGKFGPIGETEWLEYINSNDSSGIKSIVAHADLSMGKEVRTVLEAHKSASQKVCGIRDMLSWQPTKRILNGATSEGKMSDSIWRKGLEQLSKFDLSFEATIYDNQIDELNELAKAYPNQKIMLCHAATPIAVGGPFGENGNSEQERDRIFKTWKEGIAKLAEHQNVWVKISGLAMPVLGFGFEHRKQEPSSEEVVDLLNPLVQHLISAFRIERCIFGSNFPIEKVSLSYELLIDSFQKMINNYSEEDQRAFFNLNAKKFYKIT